MFYEQMANHYHHIFPAAPKVPFLADAFMGYGTLLDIGCSDGRVAQALNAKGHPVTGIDLSDAMILVAKGLAPSPTLHFANLDMLEIEKHLGASAYHGLYCIGNTLVHLPSNEAISQALHGFFQVLKSDGRLVLQILNYDWFLEHQPATLPLIDNEILRFERFYNYISDGQGLDSHQVDFATRLTIKATAEVFEGSTPLLPLTKKDLEAMVLEAGFKDLKWFGDYNGNPLTCDSTTLILVADKLSSTIIK